MVRRLLLALLLATASTAAWAQCPQVWSSTHINGDLSGGGTLTVTKNTATNYGEAFGQVSATTGKWYWEQQAGTADNTNNTGIGMGNTSTVTTNTHYLGLDADTIGAYPGNGQVQVLGLGHTGHWYDKAVTSAVGSDRIAQALDLVNNRWWWQNITRNTAWYGASTSAGDPSTNSGGMDLSQVGATILNNPVVPGLTLNFNTDTMTGYFAPGSWTGTAPSGFLSFCPCVPGSLASMGVGAC